MTFNEKMVKMADLEKAYASISLGKGFPNFVVMPEGVFSLAEDNTFHVYDYDAEGNMIEVSQEEQGQRVKAFFDRTRPE